jgi:hypothetical protein
MLRRSLVHETLVVGELADCHANRGPLDGALRLDKRALPPNPFNCWGV